MSASVPDGGLSGRFEWIAIIGGCTAPNQGRGRFVLDVDTSVQMVLRA